MSSKIIRCGFIERAIKTGAIGVPARTRREQMLADFNALFDRIEYKPVFKVQIDLDRIFLENPHLTDQFRKDLEARFHTSTNLENPDALTKRHDQEPHNA